MKTLNFIFLVGFLLLLLPGISFAVPLSECQNVSTSTMLYNNIEGAPINAAPRSGTACIKIIASDLVFDCGGFNITNNGTGGTTHGILLNGSLTNVTVKNCGNVSGYTYGVYVFDSDYNRIENNTVDNNTEYGLMLHASNYNNLTDNTQLGSNQGYFVSQGSGNRFENNTASSNDINGFYIQLNSNNNHFIDNTADGNTQNGFYIYAASNNNNFSNNVLTSNNVGFYINSSSNTVEYNEISGGDTGIYLTGTGSSNNLFSSNTLSGGTGSGVYITSAGTNNNIASNNMSGYSIYGLYQIYTNESIVSNNNASNNNIGFYLFYSFNNNLTENTATNNYNGFYIDNGGSNNFLSNNATENSDIGFATVGSTGNYFYDNNAFSNNYNGFAIRQGSGNQLISNNASANGNYNCMENTFHLSQLGESSVWEEKYAEPYPVKYATRQFTFNKVEGRIALRIVQVGSKQFADVDAVQLTACGQSIFPEYARYVDSGQSVLDDINEIDYNVVLAHEDEIEVSWNIPSSCNEPATVSLTANEYSAGSPMLFPDAGLATVSGDATPLIVDGVLDENDGVTTPDYTVFWMPGSGHPDGNLYVYTGQDDNNVYVSLDVTPDNTDEYGEDWAELTFVTSSGTKVFRIDDFSDEYGKCAFGLTSKVSYKHQTCEFSIPKDEIGNGEYLFMLRYYGTLSSSTPAGIFLDMTDNNLVQGNEMSLTLCGYGGFVRYSTYNNLTNNTGSSNDLYGSNVYDSNHTIISGDHYYNNSVGELRVESAFSRSFIMELSEVIFDNPLGNLVNYTTLSLNDEVDMDGAYWFKWAAVPSSPPNPSFENKSINITLEFGTAILDSIIWHWSDAEASAYTEAGLELYSYNSSWVDLNGLLNTGANTLSLTNLMPVSPGKVYAILAGAAPTTPSSGGDDSKKTLAFTYGQICPGDSIQVNVTEGSSPLENANVRIIYIPTYTVTDLMTDSNGQATFTAEGPGEYKIRVEKPKYFPEEETFTYTACPSEEVPPVEPPPVEPPPVTPPPLNITIPPFLNVADQEITDSFIEIYAAFFDQPGCIVLHVVNPDGSPGAVVGMSDVFSGNKSEFNLDLTNYNNETELMAMLHYDDGDGICEPAEDEPALIDGTLLSVHFKLTMPPAAPPVEPDTPTPPPATPDVAPATTEQPDDFSGFLMLLILLLLVGGGAALYYFFGMKKK